MAKAPSIPRVTKTAAKSASARAKAGPASPKSATGPGDAMTKGAKADGAITAALLTRCQTAFESDPRNLQSMNAVTATPVNKVALNRRRASKIDHSFSHHLAENKATSQNSSGRCWMFAALNTFRVKAIEAMNMENDFELSQSYVCFWDKLEKANYFLENLLATLDEPVGSRLLDYLLRNPIQDGGQWHMFINLIEKYGVVPKSVMPETDSSSNTGMMNALVTAKLREFACRLREAAGSPLKTNGKSAPSRLRALKEAMISDVYRMLCIHLGEPPSEFEWQWRDKDKKFNRAGRLTPKGFYDKYVGIDLGDLVCMIHDPRPFHRYNEVYTVQFLGNVVGGKPVVYLNVDIDTMKRAAIEQIKAGEPVWFGCDVGKFLDRDMGVMDPSLFEYSLVYGFSGGPNVKAAPILGLSKAERLMYGQSEMTHAMVFTGVNLDDEGKPSKWRVENSWSDKPGDKGFFQMGDAWFDEFNYEVVVQRRFVPKAALAALSRKPVELPPWDPMGSLA
jgi:bleomycin hydrolase